VQATTDARIFLPVWLFTFLNWGWEVSFHILLGTFAKHFNVGVVCFEV
jgi:hypothetical protein